jgi:lactoylglutathione lyase
VRFGAAVIYVEDVRETLDFYRRAFGLETRFYDATLGYGELAHEGGSLLAVASHETGEFLMPGAYPRPAQGERPSGVEIAFETTDVRGAFDRAVAAGATPVAEPRLLPWGATAAYVRSIEGTLIGFGTPVPETRQAEE